MQRAKGIQLMRPALLLPLLRALDREGLDSQGLLEDLGLTRREIRDNTGVVTSHKVHRFVQRAAHLSADPLFCWNTGLRTDPRKYLMFAELVSRSSTLGELFISLSLATGGLASASRFDLHVQGDYASLTGNRLYRTPPAPHTEAYGVGAQVALFRQ